MSDTDSIAIVEGWIGAFNDGWPDAAKLREFLTDDALFVERPSLVSPRGSQRDLATMAAGVEAGRKLLSSQRYDVFDHAVAGDRVVTRMKWTGTIAIDAGPWKSGTQLTAWCTAHYDLRDGKIARIEQYDCYEAPAPPQ